MTDEVAGVKFAGVENDGPSKNRGWNLQEWKMTDEVAGVEFQSCKFSYPVWRSG